MNDLANTNNNNRVPSYLAEYPWGAVSNNLIGSIGLEKTVELILARGGSRLSIPNNSAGTIIENIIGADAARELCRDFCGERFDIPKETPAVATWLYMERSMSQEKIARLVGRSRRSVQLYLNRDFSKSQQTNAVFKLEGSRK